MNNSELIKAVADRTGSTQAVAKANVEAVFGAITEQMRNGDEVSVTGFGKFATVDRAARTGRNPHTGETVQIAASRKPKFTAASGLKGAVK